MGFNLINTSHFWFVNDPCIFAIHSKQIFYINDPKFGSNRKVVQIVQNKHIWDVPKVEDLEIEEMELIAVPDVIEVNKTIQNADII